MYSDGPELKRNKVVYGMNKCFSYMSSARISFSGREGIIVTSSQTLQEGFSAHRGKWVSFPLHITL